MSIKNVKVDVTYWEASSGITEQCLSNQGQSLFNRASALYLRKTGMRLSKMRVYEWSHEQALDLKKSDKVFITYVATAAIEVRLVQLMQTLRKLRDHKPVKKQSQRGGITPMFKGKIANKTTDAMTLEEVLKLAKRPAGFPAGKYTRDELVGKKNVA